MMALSVSSVVKSLYFSGNNDNRYSHSASHNHSLKHNKSHLFPVSASLNPSPYIPKSKPQQQQQLYQPFRPPPSPLPSQFATLDTAGRIEVLANRLGTWHEYAPLISSLIHDGFTPPSIEELTGISGVEQNRLVVAAQVWESLQQSNSDPDVLSAFDTSGAEILYEIRLLSASQRSAAARYIVDNKFDGKGAQNLARAMKDFPGRKGEKGWESFDYTLSGDCLSFMYYRQSREHKNPSDQRTSALEQALKVAVTEKAKNTVLEELKGKGDGNEEEEDEVGRGVLVPVVRLRYGEVAESTSVIVLPVCKAEKGEKEVMEAPFECKSEGEFGVVRAEKAWRRWVVLPRWEPVATVGRGGVVISFLDARILPLKVNKYYKEEPILVVADRENTEVIADDGFYLAKVNGHEGLMVHRGLALKEDGVKESLGMVVLVIRPPKDDIDDQLSDEDWD
ncbi:rubisco accumulation factor 1.1, chloroplastic-like [Arachis stenosperma]|uniref:rubisco accumulation factor 1.1, chloroplastic-like n=1 Tax=Arachis stenosperma TaxID=217475 RepID=UPI0025AC7C74|nr:rubisco accumulation factor 1.1, chloroplastic-like [Arachis stenosperma]